MAFALPVKLSLSQPTSFLTSTLPILSPIPPQGSERAISHHFHHKHMNNPSASFYPITYSSTQDLTSTCTSHGPPPALAHLHGNTTTQAPPHKPPLLSFPLTSSQNIHLKSTFASQGPASALPPQHSALTSQAPAQARALLLPYHLLTHQRHHKHLHNPPPSSCPNCYTANTDLTSTCTSQLRTPALSPTAPPLTTYAAAQTRDCLLP